MPYCTHCGNRIGDGAQFCANCGKAVEGSTQDGSKRTQTYQGEVRKCPSCGAEVLSFTAFCSTCGHEFNSARVSSSIQNFTEKLHEYDTMIATSRQQESGWNSWSTAGKIGWVILNIYLICIPLLIYSNKRKGNSNGSTGISSKAISQQKASYIENYVFPNEREAILEALLFIKSQVTHYSDGSTNRENAFWIKIWVNKATQLNQKAELIMQDDPVAGQTYYDIAAMYQRFSKRQLIKRLIIIGALLLYCVWAISFGGKKA